MGIIESSYMLITTGISKVMLEDRRRPRYAEVETKIRLAVLAI